MKSRILTPIVLILALLLNGNDCTADAPLWRAGVARTTITPEGSYWMAGYASRKWPSEGTLQDLYAKAIAIDDANDSRIVIVTMDLLVITKKMSDSICTRVKQEYDLPKSRLLLNCSHTHCGPEVRLYREQVHNIPSVFAKKMHEYVKTLEDKLVGLVGAAIEKQRPAHLSISQSNAKFAVNRRNNREADVVALRKDRKLKGPVDHAVPVMQVCDQDGKTIAILFGYACHNTVLSFYETSGDCAGFAQQYIEESHPGAFYETCGDYAGFAQQYIEESHPGAQAMFVMGAGGDQNPLPRRRVEYVRQYGKALAAAVEQALAKPQRAVDGSLHTARSDAQLEFQPHADRDALKRQSESKNQYQRWKANYILSELDAGREIPRQ